MGQDVEDGRLVGGRYRLEGVLGRGGMGTVWRGQDETLGRTVAVKELRFPSSVDEEEKQRLITRTLREAKAIARIRSGSAITVFDVVDEDHRPWIVMELIEGRSLADQIRQDGPLEPKRVAEVGLAVLDVLRAAHREGILHRDVKPSNVLLEEGTGRVVLTDFGIAKVEGDPSITSTGMLVGAPSYISPERARGNPPGPPADLWSLGGLLYAAVEGRPPYDKGSAISTLTAVMTEPLPPPERAGGLTEVIFGLLEKDPDDRLDVSGARVLLERALNGEDTATSAGAGGTDATRAVPLPVPPPSSSPAAGTAGAADGPGAGGPRSGERLRGALQSVRNASATSAATSGAAGGSGGAAAARSGSTGAGPASGGAAHGAQRGVGDLVSRRTLVVIVALVAVLTVLGVVLALAANGGEDDKSEGSQGQTDGGKQGESGTGDKGASGGKGEDKSGGEGDRKGDGEQDDKQGGGKQDDKDGKDGKDGGKKGDGKKDGALPKGYEKVTDDRFHFSMAMPSDFRLTGVAGANSGGKYGRSGDSYPRVQVDYNSSPLADAALAWKGLEPAVKRSSPGYRLVSIKKVDWRGYPTVADWTFERNENNSQVRVLNRGFKVDSKRGYAIMVTCKAGTWDDKDCRTLRETAFETFEPK